MRHHIFTDHSDQYPVALLFKHTAFSKKDIESSYLDYLNSCGIAKEDVAALTLAYNESGKAPASFIKEYLGKLLKSLAHLGTTHLYVTDAAYFKVLAGVPKADPHHGYALSCKIKGYEHMTVVLGVNYQQLIYNPTLHERLKLSLDTLASSVQGTYQDPGSGIIRSAQYPQGYAAIQEAIQGLHQYPSLACDIEAFSLKFNEAGIGTVAFAWDQHNGVAFAVDYLALPQPDSAGNHGVYKPNVPIRLLLQEFFETYQGELIFHRCTYDVKCTIAALWMDNLLDTQGLLRGLEVMTRNMHDSMIIAYLATNSTAGNQLSLKHLAQEFAGNWAVEVKDIRKQPLDKLLQYNLVDALSTHYVRSKYEPIMEADEQGELYRGLFKDSLKLIIQLELTGMPMSSRRIQEVKQELEALDQGYLDTVQKSPVILELNLLLQEAAWQSDFDSRKDKAKNPEKIKPKELGAFRDLVFNPNSGPQLQKLLYEQLRLPVLDYTDSKAPATGADTLEKLINHTQVPEHKELLQVLIGHGKVSKILTAFIPAFEEAVSKDDTDTVWLHGSFNLGGTVSGRLSSSDPNLQNIPAGNSSDATKAKIGKLIKSCFVAPQDWIFAGADFASLEDYISALTTKDKNKLRVYEQGFDGHCLRAAYYFKDQLPHINVEDPQSVNSIKTTHPELRQESKAPTFLLTYGGTYHGMMSNLGWGEEQSKAIEKGYHDLYKESDEYVQRRLQQASKDGFVTVAFGLRVRTPLLKQVVLGASGTPYEAAAEGRTAGNALGQSYGLLNNRAAVAFFKEVWASPYRLDILPVALIHDAIYVLIRDDVRVVSWANAKLIEAMKWQELTEIQHPTVKLGAALDLFWPSWAEATTLPNDATQEQILSLCRPAPEPAPMV